MAQTAAPSSLTDLPSPAPPEPRGPRGALRGTRVYTVVHEEVARIDDVVGHVVVIRDRTGRDVHQRTLIADRVIADVVDGEGYAFGHGTVHTEEGNQVHYSFVGRVGGGPGRNGAPRSSVHGTWTLTGGTGPWRRRTGRGVFTDLPLGSHASVSRWHGHWEPAP